jgi:hypothetical protein
MPIGKAVFCLSLLMNKTDTCCAYRMRRMDDHLGTDPVAVLTETVLLDLEGPFFNSLDGDAPPKQFEIEDSPADWFPDERLDPSK